MKRLSIVAALVTSACLSVTAVYAEPVNVPVTATIEDSPCTIKGPASVDLGSITKNTFAAKGSKSNEADFTIDYSNCPVSAKNALIQFQGVRDSTDPTLFKVSGTATGLAMQITDNGVKVEYSTSEFISKKLTGTNMQIPFKVSYVSVSPLVSAGSATSTISYVASYN